MRFCKDAPKITVVSGPPCAGKSTYIAENKRDGDLVVDLDYIASAFGASNRHMYGQQIKNISMAARRAAIDYIFESAESDSWIVDTSPGPLAMSRYEQAGAEIVVLDPGKAECISRAQDRPEGTIEAIEKWYGEKSISLADRIKAIKL